MDSKLPPSLQNKLTETAINKWLFGQRSYRVLVLGEDRCGKTSFIHRLKYNEALNEPTPTVASNVQTVEYPVTCAWHFYEFRTTRDLMPAIRSCLSPETLVLWLHDCEREEASLWLFSLLLAQVRKTGCAYIWVVLNKQDTPGIGKEKLLDVRQAYQATLSNTIGEISWRVLSQPLSAKTGEGVIEVLDEMHTAVGMLGLSPKVRRDRRQAGSELQSHIEKSCQAELKENSAEDIETLTKRHMAEDTLDADTFWNQFLSGELSTWNHYYYLKAAYILILDSVNKPTDTAQEYRALLRRFREHAPHLFRNIKHPNSTVDAQFNITMTVFWILRIQHTIREYRAGTMMEDLPSRNDFHRILKRDPSLMDNNNWNEYYSYHPAFTANQDKWMAPSLRPLEMVAHYRTDPVLLPAGEKRADRVFRYAFAVLRYIERAETSRDETIAQALATFQKTTIRLRTHDASLPPYSETQTRFWIQIVDAVFRTLQDHDPDIPADLTFEVCQEMFKLHSTSWKIHYTERTWHSIGARGQFVPPDIEPLPTEMPILSPKTIMDGPDWWSSPGLPSIEELSFKAAMVIQDQTLTCDLPITSHAHLLFYLYTALAGANALTVGQQARSVLANMTGPLVAAATHRNFWIQQVGVARMHADMNGVSTFAEFLTTNLHLVFEGLPGIYYSPGVWVGAGRDEVAGSDRRRLATIVGAG
ncbi:hypothetical protein BDW62DRAFT_186291 [Aspergillus aurantiobrunneus]